MSNEKQTDVEQKSRNVPMLKLDEKYRIEPDVASWNLIYEAEGDINAKTGKPTKAYSISYHANLRQAVSKYCDEQLKLFLIDTKDNSGKIIEGVNNAKLIIARIDSLEAFIKSNVLTQIK